MELLPLSVPCVTLMCMKLETDVRRVASVFAQGLDDLNKPRSACALTLETALYWFTTFHSGRTWFAIPTSSASGPCITSLMTRTSTGEHAHSADCWTETSDARRQA
eukprot:253055-Pelagomonas_calceolata.AAC.3